LVWRKGFWFEPFEHDPEKACPEFDPGWTAVFRKDHAPPKIWSAMTIQLKAIAL